MRAPRAIVLDFDGVVLESVAVKTRAFRELIAADSELQDRIERFHLDNLGLSRYQKFTWIYEELLKRPLAPDEMNRLDRRFAESIASLMRTCSFVPGALEFLRCHAPRWPLFVASATPEGELRSILADRGLTAFFTQIYGAPTTKADALRRVVRDVGGRPEDTLFVGDSRHDAEAAREVGVTFIARVTAGANGFDNMPVVRVTDLAELQRRLADAADS